MGSAFAGLNLHRKKRFKFVLTKEFSALADEEGKSSELSGYLFGEDLSEKIKEQLEPNRITRRVVVGEDKTKSKSVNAAHRKHFSQRRKRVVRRPSYRRRSQKGTAFSKQCRLKLQPNYRRNFSKDSNLYGQMDRVNRRSRDFRYYIRLSTGFFGDPSSAKTTNSIQPSRRGGEAGGFGGGETSEEGGYRGGRTLRKSVSVKHFHDTQEGWREKAGGRHEGLEQFHVSHLPSVLWRGGFYVQDRLERHISNDSSCKKIKDLPEVSLERETLPDHMSTFRPQILSKNFHKGSETPLGLPQSSGSSTAGVFRRHTYHGSNPRAMSGAYAADMAVVDRFRFSGKHKEVSFNTKTTSRIPEVHCKFHRNEIVFSGRKTVKIKTRSRDAAEIKPSGKDIGKLLGLLPVNSSSHCSGSSPFQKFTGRYDKSLKRLKGGGGGNKATRVQSVSLQRPRKNWNGGGTT